MERLRLLLVEGDAGTRETFGKALEASNYQVSVAETYEEARRLEDETRHDIHLVDLDMSLEAGLSWVQKVRLDHPIAVAVVTTTREDQDVAIRALECGARSFVHKPATAEDICLKLAKARREYKRNIDVQSLLSDLIVDRSDLRHKVAERERLLTHLLDAAPFGIISTGIDGRILTANAEAARMYGLRADEMIGGHLPFEVPDHLDEDGVSRLDCDRDGGGFQVLLQRRRVRNHLNRPVADLYVLEDQTEKKQMEDQLLEAERLSLLGQMAPRIAHELKTPLQIVVGSTELATMAFKTGDDEMQRTWLNKIPEGVNQIRDLVEQMMNLGKPSTPEMRDIRMQDEIPKLVADLEPIGLMKYCVVECQIGPDIPTIHGDPAEIAQVFRNLIVNAVHAMETTSNGLLRVTGARSESGDSVVIRVEDTGVGIEEDHLDRIFEPFYTTKPDGKGTGLGLPIVKTIVDRYHGSIDVSSRRGAGTTFTVKFPASG